MFRFSDLIIFELTRNCNLNCKYCYVQDRNNFRGESIDFTLYKHLIDRIAEQRVTNHLENNVLALNFHGGEATSVGKKHFIRCAEYAVNKFSSMGLKFKLGLQTNGTFLDDEFLDILKHYAITIGLSFDSIVANDNQRFPSQIKEKILKNCELAYKKDIKIGTLSVLTKKTKDFVVEDDEAFKKAHIVGRKINFAEDVVNPQNSDYELSGKEIFESFLKPEVDRYLKKKNSESFEEEHVSALLNNVLLDFISLHSNSFNTGCNGRICGAGISMLAVRPDGTMGYCDRYSKDFKENFIEHALDYDFLGLHQLNMAIQLAKTKHYVLKETGCDHCRARYICEGGCQAFFYSKFGYYGIQKEIVCDQFKAFYDYCKEKFLEIVNFYIEKNITIEIPFGTIFYSFKEDVLDDLYEAGIEVKKRDHRIKIRKRKNV